MEHFGGISAQNKALSFSIPDGSGTLRLGIIENDSSRWLDEKQTQLHIDCHPLSDTKGFILEIENKREDITLGWAFGGCDATTPETDIEPQYCEDNVFNVEGTQVTVYHGKVMQLKVTNLIVPSGFFHSFIRRTQATYSVGTFHIRKENGCSRTGSNLPDS